MGDNLIHVDGGRIEVQITFDWDEILMVDMSGTATAVGISNQLNYVKKLIINNDNYSFKLMSAVNFSMPDDAFQLLSSDPPLGDYEKGIFL
jgi:hypothetical protein